LICICREVVISRTQEGVDAAEAMIMHVVLAARCRQGVPGGEKPPLEPDTTCIETELFCMRWYRVIK
jgi:hypothetical protein